MSELDFPLQAYDLTCERQEDPLGIDDQVPVLAWKLASSGRDPEQSGRNRRQSAYCVRVVKDADPRDESVIPVWDSGMVRSESCVDVPYGGKPLESTTRYRWAVRVLDEEGRDGGWSEPASFETAFLSEPLEGANWIEPPERPTAGAGLDTAAPSDPHLNVERIWLPQGENANGAPVRFRPPGIRSDAVITDVRVLADAGDQAEIRASVDDLR